MEPFSLRGALYYLATARIDDHEGLAVVPLLGRRARIIRHLGWSDVGWRFLEGW